MKDREDGEELMTLKIKPMSDEEAEVCRKFAEQILNVVFDYGKESEKSVEEVNIELFMVAVQFALNSTSDKDLKVEEMLINFKRLLETDDGVGHGIGIRIVAARMPESDMFKSEAVGDHTAAFLANCINTKEDVVALRDGISEGTWDNGFRELKILNKAVRLIAIIEAFLMTQIELPSADEVH